MKKIIIKNIGTKDYDLFYHELCNLVAKHCTSFEIKEKKKANPFDAAVSPPEVREQLAEYAHNAWSGWMKYLFGKSIPYKPGKVQAKEGALIIPLWAVERWKRQTETHYKDLPEDEKESDREEADKMIAIIKAEGQWK